jgi:hypothetical protein
LKTDANIPAVSNKQGEKTNFLLLSGQWTATKEKTMQDPDPDPYQNDMDPQHCFTVSDFILSLPHHTTCHPPQFRFPGNKVNMHKTLRKLHSTQYAK